MNKRFALLALTGVLALASCGQQPEVVEPNIPVTTPIGQNAPTALTGAYYINAEGQTVQITQDMLQNAAQNFVFYAWLENEANGVNPLDLGAGAVPTAGEREEVAPLKSQNLTGAYVGYRAPDGKIYPVVGAGVRWDINEDKSQTAVRFATADDGAVASGAIRPTDVNDNAMSATTFTNSATNSQNARFPTSTDYPLNNVTGVNTPDTNGFTWTALWVPSGAAGDATVTAIAEINGTEINKTVLTKHFAPSAKLEITKTVDPSNTSVGLNKNGTFTVTVKNTGEGNATNIKLNDVMADGDWAPYTIDAPAGGTLNNRDGFDATFDLAAGESRTFTFKARSSAVGVYCDIASITSYDNGAFGTVSPNGLRAEACLTVTAPTLNIVKTLVDGQGNVIPNGVEVSPKTPVYARITVTNGGNAPATNVVVTDSLVPGGPAAAYAVGAVTAAPQTVAVTANGDDGFTTAAFNLAAGETQTFTFPAAATDDGTFCDVASMTATSNNGTALTGESKHACFTVVSPKLNITKFNTLLGGTARQAMSLLPGQSYDSVISVANTGTGTATNVDVNDILGNVVAPYNSIEALDSSMALGGGSFETSKGQRGSIVVEGSLIRTVPATLNLAAGETLTLRLTSTVPAGSPAGTYCNVASYTSSNAGTGTAQDCVTVRNIIAVATAMDDDRDPVTVTTDMNDIDGFIMTSSIAVETRSNEAARNNVVSFFFGSSSARGDTPGYFRLNPNQGTTIYYNPNPARDLKTGAIIEPASFDNSRVLVEGVDYTITNEGYQQTVVFKRDLDIAVGGIVYFRHKLYAPADVKEAAYNSGLLWNYVGASSGFVGETSAAESTTVSYSTTVAQP